MLARVTLSAAPLRSSPLLARPLPTLLSRALSRPAARTLSTIPTQPPSYLSPPPLYPPGHEPQPERNASKEFYRALVPAMLHCLALGSIVYYAMELAWMWLSREKEGVKLKERVEELEAELEVARRSTAPEVAAPQGEDRKEGRWWKVW
ncbi:hypothetical protein JCM10213_004229 [Rhodosporidiobolus nylandii]